MPITVPTILTSKHRLVTARLCTRYSVSAYLAHLLLPERRREETLLPASRRAVPDNASERIRARARARARAREFTAVPHAPHETQRHGGRLYVMSD